MKKALRETQTQRAGYYNKPDPKKFAPPQTPFPGGAGWPKFNQLEIVTTFTYKPSLVRIDARNFELSWLDPPTNTARPLQTDRIDYTAPLSLARSVTRSSADADNRIDAFSDQSRSTNMVPFHMLHIHRVPKLAIPLVLNTYNSACSSWISTKY